MIEAKLACEAKYLFNTKDESDRNKAIENISSLLISKTADILAANKKDLIKAKSDNLDDALIDRLKLTAERIQSIANSAKQIAKQDQVVGEVTESITRADGLLIQKERIPLGVIGMIFESRPNVVIDCSCLAIKSGNCIILKGGKEAKCSNQILAKIVQEAIENFIPKNTVQLINSRDDVALMLSQVGLIDVIIPRGGEKLIQYVYDNSKVPVIAHFKGLCHIFIDQSANLKDAINIVINAKTQRPGVCNALETLLIHKDLPTNFADDLILALIEKGTEVRVCNNTQTSNTNVIPAIDQDWDHEYLSNIISIKTVDSLEHAITHIQKHGSQHTESIISETPSNIELFKKQVDASSIMINASTRFNDGGEYGLGAELGISTTKLHAYGPMGAKEMTTQRYIVTGKGHIRA